MSEMGKYGMVGMSDPMQNLYGKIDFISGVRVSVLITGESGTGKELVTDAISEKDQAKPFSHFVSYKDVDMNVAILDSITGTLYLEEVAYLNRNSQLALVKAADNSNLDMRIIASTKYDVDELLRDGTIERGMYDVLSSLYNLHVPALRERAGDIDLLTDYFLEGRKKIDDDARSVFGNHDWLGNVRELKFTIEKLVTLIEGDIITPAEIYRYTHLTSEDTKVSAIPTSLSREVSIENLLEGEDATKMRKLAEIAEITATPQSAIYQSLKDRIIQGSSSKETSILDAYQHFKKTENNRIIENIETFLKTGETRKDLARARELPEYITAVSVSRAAEICGVTVPTIANKIVQGEVRWYLPEGKSRGVKIFLEDLEEGFCDLENENAVANIRSHLELGSTENGRLSTTQARKLLGVPSMREFGALIDDGSISFHSDETGTYFLKDELLTYKDGSTTL